MGLFKGKDALPPDQARDTRRYFINAHPLGAQLLKLAYEGGRWTGLTFGAEQFIEALCKWAPKLGGIHFVD